MEKRQTSKLLTRTAEMSVRYLDAVSERRVTPTTDALSALRRFQEPLPETGCDPDDVLALLEDAGSPATVASTGGRYFGFVTGATLPASLAANWLASTWDQNAGMRAMSPIAAALEDVVIRWVCESVGLPVDCAGGLVTGATMANFTALAAARYSLLAREGWNVVDDGLFGAPPIDVVVGAEVHASLLKALNLLGLGQKRVKRVDVDEQGRMRADRLPELTRNTIVCIQAGNVNTGAFDPATEICAAAHQVGAWVHVDGAFGFWAGVSPLFEHLWRGCRDADSWATDAHKWPNVTYDCGVALVKDAVALRASMGISAAYLAASDLREPLHYVPESSRRARGVELWAGMKSLGRCGLRELVERTCEHARRFAAGLREAGYPILNDVVINQVLVSFGSASTTLDVIRRVQEDGTCWCGGTVWQGKTAMRISVSSWATTEADVEKSLAAIRKAASESIASPA
ncbi:MAG: aminotransferase class V-fold PLP-dependent enzyme [Candidatus Velthaea sp.]|jgi:glutamate/tyrosine decarboxylase-like PLP-dependent enzyme